MTLNFKKRHSLDNRKMESTRIKNKYPERVPVICEKSNNGSNIPDLDKSKYLVPCDLSVGQFIYVIRKRIKLSSEQAIFIFAMEIFQNTSLMCDLYEYNKMRTGSYI